MDSMDPDESDDSSENKPSKRNGRRKIKIEYIEDKNRRHITFSKRKAGIMKKAYELSTLTGTQVLLLVVSETGLVYTFTTTKLQPIVTKSEGKNLIQACLNSPDAQDIISESKPEDEYIPRQSNESVTSRPQENKSVSKQVSPQTAASNSPMMQPSPNMMRPVITNSSTGSVNYPQTQHYAPPSQQQSSQQQSIPMPYNQPRYPQGYNNANLPQPNTAYPSHAQYGQVPFYSNQHYPTNPPPTNYWNNPSNNQRSVGKQEQTPYQLKNEQ
ncbi:hypothetical protein BDB01DRAFT_849894 [Pilobolus umbonatus]|nr:hypothetical protein BDB01DRAFT_849894 [Pilobolus umbonatus]